MQKERKGTGLLIAILLIIILILISLVGFFIYNDYYLKDDTKESTIKEEDSEEELSLTDTKVIDIEKKIDSIHNYCTPFSYFYRGENINNLTMSNKDKVDSVIDYLDLYSSYTKTKLYNNSYYYELTSDTIESIQKSYKILFGEDQEFIPGDSYSSDLLIIKVNNKYLLADTGCGNDNDILNITQKVIKTAKEIKLYKKVGYILYEGENITYSAITTDISGKNIIAKLDSYNENINTNEYFEEQMEDNIDKFDTYAFTFKLDETGNYYFYSSEKA